MNIDSILKVVRGIVRLRGNTTNDLIGNVGDRLKVDAAISQVPYNKLVYFDLEARNAGSPDMDVDGDPTPVEFTVGPPAGEVWYIFEFGISLEDAGNQRTDSFGAIVNGLTNGLLIEQQIDSVDYEFRNFMTNLEIVETFTDHAFRGTANSFLNATNFFTGKMELREAVTLTGDDGDVIKVTVRDDLSGIDLLRFNVEGYRVI